MQLKNSGEETFIVMEYIDGIELKDKIKSNPVSLNEVLIQQYKLQKDLGLRIKKELFIEI